MFILGRSPAAKRLKRDVNLNPLPSMLPRDLTGMLLYLVPVVHANVTATIAIIPVMCFLIVWSVSLDVCHVSVCVSISLSIHADCLFMRLSIVCLLSVDAPVRPVCLLSLSVHAHTFISLTACLLASVHLYN